MARARHETSIAASPARVMAVLTDFEAYPDFLPWVQAVTVLRRERGAEHEAWEARFDLLVVRPLSFVLRLERTGQGELSWTLVEGTLRANDGSWRLESLPDGAGTQVAWEVELRPGSYVPNNILASLRERELPDLLSRVATRVLSLEASR